MEYLTLLAIPLAAFFAYEKGNPRSRLPKAVALILYGMAVSVALFGDWTAMAVLAAAFAAGLSVGCGNAIGPALSGNQPRYADVEWWQVWPFVDNQWTAMAGLGFVRAVLCLALIPFSYTLFAIGLLIASTLAAPLAVWIVLKRYGGTLNTNAQAPTLEWQMETARSELMWKRQDQFYGALVCSSAVILKIIGV